MGVYKQLTEGGLFTLPFLVHIYDETTNIYLINDNVNLTYEGKTYIAADFSYNPAANGEATFETEIINKIELGNMIKKSRRFNCELIGVYRGDSIAKLSTYKHNYGEATWDGDKFQIKLEADDRGKMTFPALIFNNYNNRGA